MSWLLTAELFTARVSVIVMACVLAVAGCLTFAFLLFRRFLDTPFRPFLWRPRHVRYWIGLPGDDGWRALRTFPGKHDPAGCRVCAWRGRRFR